MTRDEAHFFTPLSPRWIGHLVASPRRMIRFASKWLFQARVTALAELAVFRGVSQVIGAEVQSAAAILAVCVDHAADVGQTAINLFCAARMIANRWHAVSDVATVFSFANGPTHFDTESCRATGCGSLIVQSRGEQQSPLRSQCVDGQRFQGAVWNRYRPFLASIRVMKSASSRVAPAAQMSEDIALNASPFWD
jgi:hypothetical protein